MSSDFVATSTTGFYGKLPIRGDFVTRNLPPDFTQSWDTWLQTALAASREQLSDDWLRYYLNSPLWRFALSSGACHNSIPYAGILMPSVDRVGRYFPFIIATALQEQQADLLTLIHEDTWFSQVEQVILTGLEDHLDLDEFIDTVAALSHPPIVASAPITLKNPGSAWHCSLGEFSTLQLNQLLQPLLEHRFNNYSLWWTRGSERINPCLNICSKMPPAEGFSALLTGDWLQPYWAPISLNRANKELLNKEIT